MSKTEYADQLTHFDKLLEQAEQIKKLKDQEFFKLFMSVLFQIRKESLERVLSGSKGESRDELIGSAKLANYIANFFDTLSTEGLEAASRKKQLLEQIKMEETREQFEQGQVRYRGHGAI